MKIPSQQGSSSYIFKHKQTIQKDKMKVMILWTVLSCSLKMSNEPNKPERFNEGSCTQMNEGATHETKVDQQIMK